jgi:hypothetical protein
MPVLLRCEIFFFFPRAKNNIRFWPCLLVRRFRSERKDVVSIKGLSPEWHVKDSVESVLVLALRGKIAWPFLQNNPLPN